MWKYLGLPVRDLVYLKKKKISIEELYGFVSSDEEDNPETTGDNGDEAAIQGTSAENVQDDSNLVHELAEDVNSQPTAGDLILLSKILFLCYSFFIFYAPIMFIVPVGRR